MINILLSSGLTTIGVSLVRAICGWLNKALEDGKIEQFEYVSLIETIFRITIPATAAFFGFGLFGLDISLLATTMATALVDWYVYFIRNKFKK